MFFIPLLHFHLLIYSIYFFIHKYIDLLSTPHRPLVDPTSTPHRPHIDPSSNLHQPYIDPTSTPYRPHIDPALNVFNTASRIVKLYYVAVVVEGSNKNVVAVVVEGKQ